MGLDARVVLLISNLEYGGAQRQVIELANYLNADRLRAYVCCLSDYVPLARDLHDADACLKIVAKHSRFDVFVARRLSRLFDELGIDLVHAFLFDAEIAARVAGRLGRRVAVIGSERNTDYTMKSRHALALRCTRRCFDAIIANSHAGKRFQMRSLGIDEARLFVVHNGVDVTRFRPCDGGGIRRELGLGAEVRVVGMFCSFKRQKNHAMYFRMAERVLREIDDVVFLCVGSAMHSGLQGSDAYQDRMISMVSEMGLTNSVRFLGNRDGIAAVFGLCDVTVLTSRREGTPNALLESMACGVPVVATDVADNAIVVPEGEAGYVVAYDDDAAMADRVLSLLSDDAARCEMGERARAWVTREFSVAAMATRTIEVYRRVLRRRAGVR